MKAGTRQKIIFNIISVIAACFFLSTCGLEEVIFVEEPTVTGNNPLYSSDEFLKWYVDFTTNDNLHSDAKDLFVGTDVYYKIYNNENDLINQRNAIINVNTTSNGSAAVNRMMDTYKYVQLGALPDLGTSVFVEKNSSNSKVKIRLKTYQDNGDYDGSDREQLRSCIYVSSKGYLASIPFRNGNTKSFDFFDDDDDDDSNKRDVEPVQGDDDYCHSDSPTRENEYYVQLFAVGIAWDSNVCAPNYSLLLDLGSVPIKKGF